MSLGEINLIGTWAIVDWCRYLFWIFLSQLLFRFGMSFWRVTDLVNYNLRATGFLRAWRCNFLGRDYPIHPLWSLKPTELHGDRFTSTVLGLLELVVYPILISLHAWALIGGWVGLKTLSSWGRWAAERRLAYQYFLIGNAFVFIVAYLLAKHYLIVK